jgi:hypothetical protein
MHADDESVATLSRPPKHLDYSLTGENSKRAVETGLSEADWYTTPVPRGELRRLLERRDGPAIRDTLLWFGLLGLTGWGTVMLWGTWWVVPVYAVYAVLFATGADSRWHECGHGTAFKTDWMNAAVYEIASFMVVRESVLRRWAHVRHHSDTIIVGRDPEIMVPRPPDLKAFVLSLWKFRVSGRAPQSQGGRVLPLRSAHDDQGLHAHAGRTGRGRIADRLRRILSRTAFASRPAHGLL